MPDDKQAGRELDVLVAERIMGLTPLQVKADMTIITASRDWLDEGDYYWIDGQVARELPHYSTDIAAAWLVVERIMRVPETAEEVRRAANTRFGFWWDSAYLWACTSQDAARRICLAALDVMEAKDGDE